MIEEAARTTSAIAGWSASRSGRMTTPSATAGDGTGQALPVDYGAWQRRQRGLKPRLARIRGNDLGPRTVVWSYGLLQADGCSTLLAQTGNVPYPVVVSSGVRVCLVVVLAAAAWFGGAAVAHANICASHTDSQGTLGTVCVTSISHRAARRSAQPPDAGHRDRQHPDHRDRHLHAGSLPRASSAAATASARRRPAA